MKEETMKSIHRLLATLSAIAVMSGVLDVSQARALDGKVYPGSMCVRWSGPNPVYANSGIGNPGTTTLYLDCPAAHDSINYGINNGWVKVLDRHFSSPAQCNLNSLYASGSWFFGWWTPFRSSIGGSASSPVETLYFGSLSSSSTAHYYYSCRVPPTYNGYVSYLMTYKVDENE
jgi:hypothetical protein